MMPGNDRSTKSDTGGRSPGKPTRFRPEYIEQARKLAQYGATGSELGDFFDVDERTIRRWRHSHPEFDQALIIGAEAANRRVEASLYQQAIGYWIDQEEIKVINGNIVRVKVKRFMPPSASAAIYWSKAKMGWRDDRSSAEVESDFASARDEEAPEVSIRDTARKVAYLLNLAGRDPLGK